MLVSTVGPFVKWGEPAVRAAIAAKGVYIDSTGEPPFIRRVYERVRPAGQRAGAALLPAMGYDYVPGALAAALALDEAGEDAVRVDIGYYAFGAGISAGTRRSAVGIMLNDGYAYRGGALQTARMAERVRSFAVKGKDRDAVSIGGSEHFGLPAVHPRLTDVNVYLGWFGALARPLQAGQPGGLGGAALPGVRGALKAAGDRLVEVVGGPDEPGSGISWVVAEAYDVGGQRLAEVQLHGGGPRADRRAAGVGGASGRRWRGRARAGAGVRVECARGGLPRGRAGARANCGWVERRWIGRAACRVVGLFPPRTKSSTRPPSGRFVGLSRTK